MKTIKSVLTTAALGAALLSVPALVSMPAFADNHGGKQEEMKKKADEHRMAAEKRHEEMKKKAEERQAMAKKYHEEMKTLNEGHQKAIRELNDKMNKDMQAAKTSEERQKLQMAHKEGMLKLMEEFKAQQMKMQKSMRM